jgi:hypothetical protein
MQVAGAQPAGAPTPTGAQQSQAVGGATSTAAQSALSQAANDVQNFQGASQNALAGESQQANQNAFSANAKLQSSGIEQSQALASLDAGVKNSIYDSKIQLQASATGQQQFQTSQLMDWAVTKATDATQLQAYAQQVQDATQKNETLMQQGYDAISQTLQAESAGQIQQMDDATKLQLAQAQQQFQLALSKAQATTAANNALITGAFTVAGVAGGALAGGPAGAVAGGTLGTGVGSAVAGGTAASNAPHS